MITSSPNASKNAKMSGPSTYPQSRWNAFLRQFRVAVDKNAPAAGAKPVFTHTSMGQPSEKVFVPDEQYDAFMDEYIAAAASGTVSLHLTEKPLEVSSVRIDLDFRFPVEEDADGNVIIERRYTRDDVTQIVRAYAKEISTIADVRYIDAYVLEKDQPSEYKRRIKDGIHIVITSPLSHAHQFYVRQRILDNHAERLFSHLGLSNKYDDVVDAAVIDCNNWTLVGSGKVGSRVYEVTRVVRYDAETEDTSDLPVPEGSDYWSQLVKLMSMRRPGQKELPIRPEVTDELSKFASHVLPGIGHHGGTSDAARSIVTPFRKGSNARNRKAHPDDFELVKRLVLECLNPARADNYNDWMRVGWALFNTDHRLLDTWKQFSAQSSKYIESECEGKWNSFIPDSLGMASIRYWCKEDNPEKYDEIREEAVVTAIDKCSTKESDGSHWDVAQCVYKCFRHDFVYVGSDSWYTYDRSQHRWVKTTEAGELSKRISTELFSRFIKRVQYWQTTDVDFADERSVRLLSIARKLKDSTYKSKIIKESKAIFNQDDFLKRLDSNTYLIGCPNGVVDLRSGTFRDGEPSDMISFHTSVDYKEHDPDSEEFKLLDQFMHDIFPSDRMREYFLDMMASSIDGTRNRRTEKMWFLTGSGCHSPDTEVRMFDGSVRAVDDIRVGDHVLGPNGTGIKVVRKHEGRSAMFRVIPRDGGAPYQCNYDHKLPLVCGRGAAPSYRVVSRDGDCVVRWFERVHHFDQTGTILRKEETFVSSSAAARAMCAALNEDSEVVVTHGSRVVCSVRMYFGAGLYKEDFRLATGTVPAADDSTYTCSEEAARRVRALLQDDPDEVPGWLLTRTAGVRYLALAEMLDRHGETYGPYAFRMPEALRREWVRLLVRSLGLRLSKHGVIRGGGISRIPTRELERRQESPLDASGAITTRASERFSVERVTAWHDGEDDNDENGSIIRYHVDPDSEDSDTKRFVGIELEHTHLYALRDFGITGNSNGKSVLMDMMRNTLGDYYGTASVSLLTCRRAASNAATPELYFLRGKRIVVTQEPGTGESEISTGVMKELTGNDEIQCRPLFGNPFPYLPQFNLFMTCNELPNIASQDEGTWRRTTVVHFPMKFTDVPDPENPRERKADPQIKERLDECRQDLLGYLVHRHRGLTNGNVREPSEVKEATKKYKAETNIVAQFAMTALEEAPGEELPEQVAWLHFKTVYGKEMGKITRNKFGVQLDAVIGSRKRQKWVGYRIGV